MPGAAFLTHKALNASFPRFLEADSAETSPDELQQSSHKDLVPSDAHLSTRLVSYSDSSMRCGLVDHVWHQYLAAQK
jgi:hypothetical protein